MEEHLVKPTIEEGTHGHVALTVPVLVVLRKPMTNQEMHEALSRMRTGGPLQPLYNVAARALKNAFGLRRGDVTVIVGQVCPPQAVPEAFAGLGLTFGTLGRPAGVELDSADASDVAAARFVAENFNPVAVSELLRDHIAKLGRGR